MRKRDLKLLMESELPSKTEQRQKKFRPTQKQVKEYFRLINREIFDNKLPIPKFQIRRLYNCVGMCEGKEGPIRKTKSHCTIHLADKYYCIQWFLSTLAHEMVHQYQWDIFSNIRVKRGLTRHMSHGPSFYIWRKRLAKHGISLKANALQEHTWFEVQDASIC